MDLSSPASHGGESLLDQAIADRIPSDVDAERGLLGCLLRDPNCSVNLPLEQFFFPENRQIARLIHEMKGCGEPVSPAAVAQRLDQMGVHPQLGGRTYVRQLVDRAPDPSTAGDCGDRIDEMWRRRNFLHKMMTGMAMVSERGVSWNELLAAADTSDLGGNRPQVRFRLHDGKDLVSDAAEQPYLIPGVLTAGQPGGIDGAFKTLKTSCTADLLLSVATGRPFLGHFPVADPGPVLFLSGESGLAGFRSMARRICAARGCPFELLERFTYSPELPRLQSASDLVALRNVITERGLKVLAIDPAYLAMDISDNAHNLFAVGQFLRPIARLCETTGCTVLIVHHCKHKTFDPFRPATLADIAWAGFAEFSAQWLLLSRRAPFDPDAGRHELWGSFGGRAGHMGLWAIDVDEGTQAGRTGRKWDVEVRAASWARASRSSL